MTLMTGRWFDMRDGTYLRVGEGKFDGWYFHQHPDGYMVSVEKAKEVVLSTEREELGAVVTIESKP